MRKKNESVRGERETAADVLANKFAVFKKDFMSSPLRAAAKAILNGTEPPPAC